MACFSKDCNFVKKNGDCFYDGIPPSSSPKTCEKCMFFKPITRADRIRAMTDEELAEFLLNRDLDVVENASKTVGFTYKVDREKCLKNVIDWLRQEAEE